MPSPSLCAAFDCSLLGMGYVNPKARTGIFRAVQQTLLALTAQPELRLELVGFNQESSPWYRRSASHYLREQAIDPQRTTLALDAPWDRYLDGPIALQKAALDHFAAAEPLRKAAVAMQLPFDKIFAAFSPLHLRFESWQVYHSPYFPLPEEVKAAAIPRIITIYDLTPIRFPELCAKRTRQQFERTLASIDCDRDWVICISEATKQDFCQHTGMDTQRVFVAPLAASGRFQPVSAPAAITPVLRRYYLDNRPYLLSLATLEPRKNLAFLVRCFLKLLYDYPSLDLNLVLVGISGWKNQGIFEAVSAFPHLRDRVVFTGFLPDSDLSAIYSQAIAFVYPSLHEGFGLPPLEAMQCGTPVITSNVSALPEVVGDAGLLVDPTDGDALCQALWRVTNDPQLRESLSGKGLAQAARFSWPRCAEATVNVYKTAINHQP